MKGVKSVTLLVEELVEDVTRTQIEGTVKVKEHKMEFAVIFVTETLCVVLWPVPVANVEFYCHVVDEFINVKHLLNLLICLLVIRILAQLQQVVKAFFSPFHLHIT